MDRPTLLTDMQAGRAALEAALSAYSPAEMERPDLPGGWSAKDVLAHIGFWEQRIATLYAILSGGDEPRDSIGDAGVDELNARVFDQNRSMPLESVRINEAAAWKALLAVAESAPEADLFDPGRFAWTEGQPFYEWIVGNAHGHYADHIPDLIAARAER
jgi:hypothetical protein